MADRPEHTVLAALVVAVGALLGLVASLTALLGRPAILAPGMLAWPGLHLPLTLVALVGSVLGLAAAVGLVTMRPWAPRLAGGLALGAMLAGLAALLLVAPLRGFEYPWPEAVAWSAVILAGTWLVAFTTDPVVLSRFDAERSFPSTSPAQPGGGSGDEDEAAAE